MAFNQKTNKFGSKDECSFCGRNSSEVKHLIQGDNARICNECLLLTMVVIQSNTLTDPKASELETCSFCNKTQNQGISLVAGPSVRICNECSIKFASNYGCGE